MEKKIRVWLAFLLSSIISIIIVVHSSSYLVSFFEAESKFLIISALFLIEIGYVALPYVAAWNKKRDERWDMIVVVVLFFLSVIPATLQTTSGFVQDYEKTVFEEPIPPLKPAAIGATLAEIDLIEKQIDSNLYTIKTMVDKGYLTKSQTVSKQNENLITRKKELLIQVSELEKEWTNRQQSFNKKKETFNENQRKSWLRNIVNTLQFLWSFLLVSILQLVNARFVVHGTAIMAMKTNEVEKKINKQELLSADLLLNKVKVTGIGKQTIEKFINIFEIWDEDTFIEIIKNDAELERIEKVFPTYIAKRLKKFCEIAKRKLIQNN